MKKENNVAYILRLTLTLLVICAVVAGLLAGVNAITKHRIAAIQQEKVHKALQLVLPGVIGLERMELSGDTGIISAVYSYGKKNYAVEVNPIGFDGPIKMMVGVVGGKVTGISIISHTETPGLGAVAAEKSAKGAGFRVQFLGLEGGIVVNGEENSIDSITGATITSKAVTAGVNAALEFVANLGKEG